MKPANPQVAGYGLYYRANNHLVPKISDRLLLQCLVDMVRPQLKQSLHNQTVFVSNKQLGRISGIDSGKTIPSSLERLERCGLIQRHTNAITVNCDLYVTLIQHYESLSAHDRAKFANDFVSNGPKVLEVSNIQVREMCRSELLGMVGTSISVISSENDWKLPTISETEPQNVGNFQSNWKLPNDMENSNLIGFIQHLMQQMAKTLEVSNTNWTFPTLVEALNVGNLQPDVFLALKSAFETGNLPNSVIFDPQKRLEVSNFMIGSFQLFAQKTLEVSNTVIIDNKKRNKGEIPLKMEDENSQEELKKGFESFSKVEIINFDEPSAETQKEDEPYEQKVLERAERAMRSRNPYKNKPFFPVERIKEIVETLDEVVKSPVDFFLYQFWWGIYDLYCDHYQPSLKFDEEGEAVDEPQSSDWKEMVGAPLPQDEIYALAKNVYEDLTGAVEQGRYVYGDNNEWEVRFGFDSFQDFNPYEMFQWTPCTMQDKSIPALRVAVDKFYDIEADDAHTAGKSDKRTKNVQNRKLVELIMSADNSQLTPIEMAIKNFYATFVQQGEDGVINDFTDANGVALESGGGLPDHLLKPWCYDQQSINYNEFTGILSTRYKPCDGIHKKATIFSADLVVHWNEKHGYSQTVSHMALQD